MPGSVLLVYGTRVPYRNLGAGAQQAIRDIPKSCGIQVTYSSEKDFAVIGQVLGQVPTASKPVTAVTSAVDTELISRIPKAVGTIGIDRLRSISSRLWLVLDEGGENAQTEPIKEAH